MKRVGERWIIRQVGSKRPLSVCSSSSCSSSCSSSSSIPPGPQFGCLWIYRFLRRLNVLQHLDFISITRILKRSAASKHLYIRQDNPDASPPPPPPPSSSILLQVQKITFFYYHHHYFPLRFYIYISVYCLFFLQWRQLNGCDTRIPNFSIFSKTIILIEMFTSLSKQDVTRRFTSCHSCWYS